MVGHNVKASCLVSSQESLEVISPRHGYKLIKLGILSLMPSRSLL